MMFVGQSQQQNPEALPKYNTNKQLVHIHIAFWTNIFVKLDKYIFQFDPKIFIMFVGQSNHNSRALRPNKRSFTEAFACNLAIPVPATISSSW